MHVYNVRAGLDKAMVVEIYKHHIKRLEAVLYKVIVVEIYRHSIKRQYFIHQSSLRRLQEI
jgi:hypothetical protein